MGNFYAWNYHFPYHIPLYLKNIAVCDLMKYWYLRGIRRVFDDKNDGFSTLYMPVNWYLNFLPIKYQYLTKWISAWK